jgi:hypothetical protein
MRLERRQNFVCGDEACGAKANASCAPRASYRRDADIFFAGAQTRVILVSWARRVEAASAVRGPAGGRAVKDVSGKSLKLQ